ncbi:translocase of the inner membrane [Polyrhizophydium stewartii]|uniref:Translocase of the inner membrane n=1 Tax=Polyrhizophydium stewartii TaxID=2732419 RepID=A0ABR4NJT5_9FUNG|nr:translocase of the inner membrane [Polyrhizophydium stewartii]
MANGEATHTADHTRDPCPYNIVSDVGIGFAMGAIGGTFWHGFKGYRNAPYEDRWRSAISSIKARAPIAGGSFAVWSGLFNAFDCAIVHTRDKEDGWNRIMAGAATGAVLAVRSGPKVMAISAGMGAVILAVMEGLGHALTRASAAAYDPQPPISPEQLKKQREEQKLKQKQQEQAQLAAASPVLAADPAPAYSAPSAQPQPAGVPGLLGFQGGLLRGRQSSA